MLGLSWHAAQACPHMVIIAMYFRALSWNLHRFSVCTPSQIILKTGAEHRHVLHEALSLCFLIVNVRLPFQIEEQGWQIMSYFRALK